ncbi:MAG TPA: Mini-ribonuclease 3 [Firmicutes bacterium]|jgi:ribonuclease-3 family protein|nr:Mini-ribonuclease 3 [Bacillota bacterium]
MFCAHSPVKSRYGVRACAAPIGSSSEGVGASLLGQDVITIEEARRLPPTTLAYLGDAVLELYVRERLVCGKGARAGVLHKKAVSKVKAAAQAEALHRILDNLTTEEHDIVRRGRNAKTGGRRAADAADYHYSTAFEALLGYLYLTGRQERLVQLIESAYAELAGH